MIKISKKDYTQDDLYPKVLDKITENLKHMDEHPEDVATFETFEEFKKYMDSL